MEQTRQSPIQEYQPYKNQHIRLNLNQYVEDLNKKNNTRITLHQFIKSRVDEILIHRYELIRELRNKNYSLVAIGKLLGLNHATIINSLHKYKGLKEQLETNSKTRHVRELKEIVQCDIDGNDIKVFQSQKHAVEELKINQSSISNSIRLGSTAGDYRFRYKDEKIKIKESERIGIRSIIKGVYKCSHCKDGLVTIKVREENESRGNKIELCNNCKHQYRKVGVSKLKLVE